MYLTASVTAEHKLIEQLRAVDAGIRAIAGELSGLGLCRAVATPRATELDDLGRIALNELAVMREALADLAQKARLLRDRHVARQRAALGTLPSELHLCLTGAAPPGWVSAGFAPAELEMNLLWGLPFADGAARFVYFALALEHFYYPGEALQVLREVRRVLAPGGVLRLVVPDLEKYLRAYAAGDQHFFDAHRNFWDWAKHAWTPLDLTLMMAGAGMERGPGDFFGHKSGYDFQTLAHLLRDAGFAEVVRREHMESPTPELRVDFASHDAAYGDGEKNYNLFVEAW
jgi:predicted SAM-dependent methyltransferase